jgi:transcriptional antiterminator NusG
MLSSPEGPHPIGNVEVNRFNALADGGKLDWERPTLVFRKDEQVRVKEGPFASFVGSIISCRGDGKGDAVVELNIFAGMTPVLIPLAILEKV